MSDTTINQAGWELAGKVLDLYRYPVKSMAGERLEEIRLGWHGLEGDRRYAFMRLAADQDCPG